MDDRANSKILVVDDEESIISFLKMGLEMEGYEVQTAVSGEMAIDVIKKFNADLVILDVMLPGIDGFESCRKIKQIKDIPIIMLTAREDVDDKVTGLNSGADDYIVKPFNFKELIARINARLRNIQKKSINNTCKNVYGEFVISDSEHIIKYKNQVLELSLTEYKLLQTLIVNNNIALSKTKLLDIVWGYDFYGDVNIVEVYIRYLRNKINDSKHSIIKTIRGVGYKLVV